MKQNDEFDKLKFMRVFTPDHIPRELVEQIKDRYFETDDLYTYLRAICLTGTNDGPKVNPFCHLYVIADEGNHVVGFAWFEINLLSKSIFLNAFSMDNKYWFKGKAVGFIKDFLLKQLDKMKLKRAFWSTRYPKHGEKNGFKRSKNILMEYQVETNEK